MKFKLKIINESKVKRSRSLENFYSLLNIHPGSLDVFWSHFVDVSFEVEMARKDFIVPTYGKMNEELTIGDGFLSDARKEKALKELRGLNAGLTYYWNKYYGKQEVDMIIEFKVLSYITDLSDRLRAINFETITSEEYAKLSIDEKAPVIEKFFMEDYAETFLDEEFGKAMMSNTGFIGNPGVGSGMAGMANDWWMTTSPEGFPMFKQKMLKFLPQLPQR